VEKLKAENDTTGCFEIMVYLDGVPTNTPGSVQDYTIDTFLAVDASVFP
jgi:hypothetical protein